MPLISIPKTDFECRYIVTSETVKQSKLIFDKCIDFIEKQLRVAYFNAKKELLFYKQFFFFFTNDNHIFYNHNLLD